MVATLLATHCGEHGLGRLGLGRAGRHRAPLVRAVTVSARHCERLCHQARPDQAALHTPPTSTYCTHQVIDIYIMKTRWLNKDQVP